MAARTYRQLLPKPVREPVWHWTRAVWARSVLGHRQEARYRWAEYCVARGRYQAYVDLPAGFSLEVDLRDEGVGRTIYADEYWDRDESAFLKAHVKPGMTIVDVGANLGYFTVLCAQLVGPPGRVIAIEPDPYNFALLQRNVARNGLTNVTLLNRALAKKPGTAVLFKSASNFGDHRVCATADKRETVEVEVETLDELLARHGVAHVDVAKIDVQGYEGQVLGGMQTTLAAGLIDHLLMEYWPHGLTRAGDDPAAIIDTLIRAGFRFHLLKEQGTLQPVEAGRLDEQLPPFDPAMPDGCFVNLLLAKS
jgi:FkbM family methyltransferase